MKIGEMIYFGDTMIDLKNITKKQIEEYDLYDYIHGSLAVKYTDFVVLGIDESKGLVYAQYDYGKPSWNAIQDITSYGYSIVGVLNHVIDGLYDLTDDDEEFIEQLIQDETVFILKAGSA